MKNKDYIVHFCANKQCNAGWVDVDRHKSNTPVQTYNCADCVAKGLPKGRQVSEARKKAWETNAKHLVPFPKKAV